MRWELDGGRTGGRDAEEPGRRKPLELEPVPDFACELVCLISDAGGFIRPDGGRRGGFGPFSLELVLLDFAADE